MICIQRGVSGVSKYYTVSIPNLLNDDAVWAVRGKNKMERIARFCNLISHRCVKWFFAAIVYAFYNVTLTELQKWSIHTSVCRVHIALRTCPICVLLCTDRIVKEFNVAPARTCVVNSNILFIIYSRCFMCMTTGVILWRVDSCQRQRL